MYYSVFKGFNKGIYRSWKECEREVKGYKGAIYKKFKLEIEAIDFLNNGRLKDDKSDFLKVYTDGSCINNGKRRDVSAGYGVFFGEGDPRNLAEPYRDRPTNNRAELFAIIRAIEIIEPQLKLGKKVIIYTDSEYSLKTYTVYAQKWKIKNWKKSDGSPVKNLELVKRGYELYSTYSKILTLKKVKAHTGASDPMSVGNDWADRLANIGAARS